MFFIDSNKYKNLIGNHFVLGDPLEVTTRKKLHKNDLIANNLSSSFIEDPFMLKYTPTNEIFITDTLLYRDKESNFVACIIDDKSHRVVLDIPSETNGQNGVLTFSSFLSLNGHITEEKLIFGNSRVKETIMRRVRVLAVGIRDDRLFALYYVPSTRGMAVSTETDMMRGISTVTLKERDCSSLTSFTIDDWFNGTKIEEL